MASLSDLPDDCQPKNWIWPERQSTFQSLLPMIALLIIEALIVAWLILVVLPH